MNPQSATSDHEVEDVSSLPLSTERLESSEPPQVSNNGADKESETKDSDSETIGQESSAVTPVGPGGSKFWPGCADDMMDQTWSSPPPGAPCLTEQVPCLEPEEAQETMDSAKGEVSQVTEENATFPQQYTAPHISLLKEESKEREAKDPDSETIGQELSACRPVGLGGSKFRPGYADDVMDHSFPPGAPCLTEQVPCLEPEEAQETMDSAKGEVSQAAEDTTFPQQYTAPHISLLTEESKESEAKDPDSETTMSVCRPVGLGGSKLRPVCVDDVMDQTWSSSPLGTPCAVEQVPCLEPEVAKETMDSGKGEVSQAAEDNATVSPQGTAPYIALLTEESKESEQPPTNIYEAENEFFQETNDRNPALPSQDSMEESPAPEQEQLVVENSDDARSRVPGCWNRIILKIHALVTRALQATAAVAVRYPRLCLVVLSAISVGLCAAGWVTNFVIETETSSLWPPKASLSVVDAQWLWKKSRFSVPPVVMDVLVHKNGDNVLGHQGVERVFEIVDYFSSQSGYKGGCAFAQSMSHMWWVGQCAIHSVADLWNESSVEFQEDEDNDNYVIGRLSATTYPNGVIVDVPEIMGNAVRDDTSGRLVSADSYLIRFDIPWSNVTGEFEAEAVVRMHALREAWANEPDNEWRVEFRSWSSYSDEFMRAIMADLWLIPVAAVIVSVFTVFFAFGKCHPVYSRGLLGVGAVLTIVASLMTTFGLLFLIGAPFTTQTMMVPFLLFGVGLDDAYILFGSYSRLDPKMNTGERIKATFDDVGVGIFLTSLTSVLAFVLGSFSQIPAVKWLCLYAFPAVAIDFFYQITFFIALMVLDEKRIQDNRMDWCTCFTVQSRGGYAAQDSTTRASESDGARTPGGPQWEGGGHITDFVVRNDIDIDEVVPDAEQKLDKGDAGDSSPESLESHCVDRLMAWWAIQLLKPWVQAAAMTAFVGLAIGSIYCATQLDQEFDFTDLVPKDSFLKAYYAALDTYSDRSGLMIQAYFRNVDQGDPEIQEQMNTFITELVASGEVDQLVYFWLWDFQKYSTERAMNATDIFPLTSFDEQIDQFLMEETYHNLYDEDIAKANGRNFTSTRCHLHASVDVQDSKATVLMMNNLRAVAASQPINQGQGDWRFFTYTGEFHLFEFYKQVINELVFNTMTGIIAVNVIAIMFIPHWTAVLFVFPFISILYVNLLGFLYLSGVQINAISYVTLVMSIGLMIDYVLHILMRYYDSKGTRRQRVQETMSTLGAPVFLGAASTFLGVMPLAFSTSDVLQNIFVTVVGLIGFGVLNGLIFLPVVLALVGPVDHEAEELDRCEAEGSSDDRSEDMVGPVSSYEEEIEC